MVAEEDFKYDATSDGGLWFCDPDQLTCSLVPNSRDLMDEYTSNGFALIGNNAIVVQSDGGPNENKIFNCDASGCAIMGTWPIGTANSNNMLGYPAYVPSLNMLFGLMTNYTLHSVFTSACPSFDPTAANYDFGNCYEVPGSYEALDDSHTMMKYHNGYLYISDINTQSIHACDPTTSPLECASLKDSGVGLLGIDATDLSDTEAMIFCMDVYREIVVKCIHDKVAKTIGGCVDVPGFEGFAPDFVAIRS